MKAPSRCGSGSRLKEASPTNSTEVSFGHRSRIPAAESSSGGSAVSPSNVVCVESDRDGVDSKQASKGGRERRGSQSICT